MVKLPLAVLLTDFGHLDPFIGIVKGVISRFAPRARFIDLGHEVPPQDIRSAAFQLMVSVPYFPEGALFVSVVDPGVGSSRAILYAETARHRFLAPDNGLLSWVFRKETPILLRTVNNENLFLKPTSRTFHGRDIFAVVAGRLLKGLSPAKLGPIRKNWLRIPFPASRRTKKGLGNEVLSVDRFGNLISGIYEKDVIRVLGRSSFRVRVGRSKPLKVFHAYAEGPKDTPFAVVGSFGYLEVAVRNGSAAKRLKAGAGDEFTVELIRHSEEVARRMVTDEESDGEILRFAQNDK